MVNARRTLPPSSPRHQGSVDTVVPNAGEPHAFVSTEVIDATSPQLTRLGDALNFKRGYDLPESARRPGPYPVISSAGVSGYHDTFKCDGEGVVTGRYGTLGEMHYVDGPYWPHNTALYVTDFKGNDPKYLYYLLTCLGRFDTGDKSTVPGVNRNDLHELTIPLIRDRATQGRIASVLSTIDAKIDLNSRISAELEGLARTIYDYWFLQFDFPDAHGLPYRSSGGAMAWDENLKSNTPVSWQARTLADLGSFRNGINYDPAAGGDDRTRIVNVRDVSGSTIFVDHSQLDQLSLDREDIDRYLVEDDAILIARSGIPGATRMLQTQRPEVVYCGFIIRYLVDNPAHKLVAFFRLKDLERSTLSKSGGSILKNVSQDTLKQIRIALPDDPLILEKFNSVIEPIFAMIGSRQEECAELTRLRDWLLPLLMNGQARVGKSLRDATPA